MWKIQIFIFVEAILLTLAALTILSVDFSYLTSVCGCRSLRDQKSTLRIAILWVPSS